MSPSEVKLSPAIRTALSELRWRIRAYVTAEGLAMAAVWIGLTFWLGLMFDYLPVLTWASEIPRGLRAAGLLLAAGGLAWILYHWLLRRLFVRLRDRSMALLVERRFKGFHDELVTAVELAGDSSPEHPYDDRMLERTTRVADSEVRTLRLADIFDPSPLIRKSLLAAALLIPIVPFAIFQHEIASIWFQRFYLLRDVPWPRDTMVELIGFQPQRSVATRQEGPAPVRRFGDDRTMKIAKGSSGTLRVQAKSRTPGKQPPDFCTIYYRSADGARSSVRMTKFGRLTDDGYQVYTLASKPFKGVLENLEFDVVASDARLQDFELDVVESPLVVGAQLHCEFPEYLVDEATSSWLPRDVPYVASGTALPVGTEVTMQMGSSKPLQEVTVQAGEDGAPQPVELVDEQTFRYRIDSLDSTQTLFFTLLDTDGVPIERPAKFVVGAVKDDPPELKVSHLGIGSMVTPDVRIPVEGTVEDDYGVARAWFALVTPDGELREYDDVVIARDGALSGGLDLRAKRGVKSIGDELAPPDEEAPQGGEGPAADAPDAEPEPVELEIGDRIAVTVMAADRYDLGEQPNVGVGVRMELEVVTPARLLTALDQRELAQRRVFEHVIEEMTAARDDLDRVLRGLAEGDDAGELELEPGEEIDEEQARRRAAALRLLRVQQAGLQSEKSASETLSVADAFQDIVLELKNNRVDSQDRQERLNAKVAEPLILIGETMFPDLDLRLERLEEAVGGGADDQQQAAKLAVEQVDEILVEMNKVLQDMLYIETYNELVETVRLIMEEQARIRERTKVEQKRGLLE